MSDTTVADPKPLPTPPPNNAVIVPLACVDGVRVRLNINYDVTSLDVERRRLLLHMIAKATKQLAEAVTAMPYLDVKKSLDQCVKGVDRSPN